MSLNVLGLGEVLWDLLPDGPQLGGAPANFACHAQALGANASVISRVGDDELGRRILERFQQQGLALHTVQVDPFAPTGTASVYLNEHGVPRFHFQEKVAWDGLVVTAQLLEVVRRANAICFGTLAQRDAVSRAAIRRLLAAAPAGALVLFDVNLRDHFYSWEIIEHSLRLANVLKLNRDELAVLGELFAITGAPRAQIQRLAERFQLKVVALTSGASGSLIHADGEWSEQPATAIPVVDTVGAGDSFAAAMILGLLTKMELSDLHAFANEVAGFVCSQPGATPALPAQLCRKCHRLPVFP